MHEYPHDHTNTTPETINPRRAMLAGLGGLAAGALLAGKAHAGPLTPPAGPISSTPGPEPRIPVNAQNTPGNSTSTFRIIQPGSYYLEGNITGESGKIGIAILANDVTLDLNGFSLLGVPGSSHGIHVFNNPRRITIRNGMTTGWGQDGIRLLNGFVPYCTVEDIVSANNSGAGIVTSSNSILNRCTVSENGSTGISASLNCRIIDSYAASNSGNGIVASQGSSIERCVSHGNTVHGIEVSFWSIVRHCHCRENGTGNSGTDGAGIRVTSFGNTIIENSCTQNGRGIMVTSSSSLISGNLCKSNTLNWSISANNRCHVVNTPSSAAISGNSGGTPSGTSDPLANFTV